MESVLKGLKPECVFKNFEKICQVPRESEHEEKISAFLLDFGKSLGLETIQDENLNIIIRKPATKGYENCPGVVLQGHMDMVCEKDSGVEHDFTKDPIKLKIDGDMISAQGTTLGADNGIAVAMAMSILESNDIDHPSLEVLITSNEENGMTGAFALDGSLIKGKYILNLDSDVEGELLVSCAGGRAAVSKFPVEYVDACSEKQALILEISGLAGGHSGVEIGEQKGNANKLMGRLLSLLNVDYDLAKIEGGTKHNAIPNNAKATILVAKENVAKVSECVSEVESIFQGEFSTSDPNVKISCTETTANKVFTNDLKDKVMQMLTLLPNGVQTMSMDIKGLVESSANIGVVETTESEVTFLTSVRSSVASLKDEVINRIVILTEALAGTAQTEGDYPAWEYVKDSKLEKICVENYSKVFNKDVKVSALHAGLECGVLLSKIANAEAISFGPNLYDIHSPRERMSISSTQNIWEYLVAVLKSMNQY